MNESLTPHFSRRILLLSIIFLLANLGIYSLKSLAGATVELESVAPVLHAASPEEIELKSPYDEDFRPAQQDQEILSGTTIRTEAGEFAELRLNDNNIQLDESTELVLIQNNLASGTAYLPDTPRLVFELRSGGIWVNAFDTIEIQAARSTSRVHHAVAIQTRSEPLNRMMVVTGDADLQLLDEQGAPLNGFVIPLHNQVTFLDQQLTSAYKALKPSKLEKELKMTPLSDEILSDDWVTRNAIRYEASREAFRGRLIQSGVGYQIRNGFEKMAGLLTFLPEAKRNLEITKAETKLRYILGGVQQDRELGKAEKLIESFGQIASARENDPKMQKLITQTLFAIEDAEFGSPAFLLREVLMDQVQAKEGAYVYRTYLTDIRKALLEDKIKIAESIVGKWQERWPESLITKELEEYRRQAQILNHTILAFIDTVPLALLDAFDDAGASLMAHSQDMEEARFEVTSDRLQIAASLVNAYRYVLAKQYLKNSYLSLNIEELSPNLASTKIFLENGRLLAQRIEYAEDVLHGAAQPIDETKFREYFQTKTRDEQLSADLKRFFELEEGGQATEEELFAEVEVPTVSEVADRFLQARITVDYSDISLKDEGALIFEVKNAHLLDRGISGQTISFDATYDYVTHSVRNIVTEAKTYAGPFVLNDLVTVLLKGGQLESQQTPAPQIQEGIELLITDEEKTAALEGQAMAQDVAKQIAFEELTGAGVIIPEAKFDIDILDALNLDKFRIKKALVPRPDEGSVAISFDYDSKIKEVTNVKSEEGVLVVEKAPLASFAAESLQKILELEKELELVSEFTTYAKQNSLEVDSDKLVYTAGLLAVGDLRLTTLGLSVNALVNVEERKFVSASNDLYSAQDIDIKEYFESLADAYISNDLSREGISVDSSQIVTSYPFTKIQIKGLAFGGYVFSFELDLQDRLVKNVAREGAEVIPEMSLDDFKELPAQIQQEEAEAQAAQEAEAAEEAPPAPPETEEPQI